jgi:hypothetical protein
MQVTIKTSSIRSSTYDLGHSQEVVQNFRIWTCVQKALSYLYEKLANAFVYLDRMFSHLDTEILALPLRYSKAHKLGVQNINHAYKDATDAQKQVLKRYLEAQLPPFLSSLNIHEIESLSKKIANDKNIFDIGGLCLGYSWIFAAFCLKNAHENIPVNDMIDCFIKDAATSYVPVLSFAHHVALADLVKKEKDQIVILGNSLRNDFLNSEKERAAKKAIKEIYPSFKLTDVYIPSHHSSLSKQITFTGKLFDGQPQVIYLHPDKKPSDEGHVITVFSSSITQKYYFFDSNIGIVSFNNLEELAKGVDSFVKKTYSASKASDIMVASI